MLTIGSNLSTVIQQLNDLKNRRLPEARDRACNPLLWQEGAREVARTALRGLAHPWQLASVESFVATVTAAPLTQGFKLGITVPEEPGYTRQDEAAAAILQGRRPDQAALLDAVTAWVEAPYDPAARARCEPTGKDLDSRDTGKTADEIARFLTFLFTAPQVTGGIAAARNALWPHVRAWIIGGQRMVDEATARRWTEAVIEAWRKWAGELFPLVLKQELEKGECTGQGRYFFSR